MNPKQFENKPFQNPDLHGYWAEYFPRVVRMGVIGALVVSAVVLAHEKFSSKPAEISLDLDQSGPDDQAD